MISLNVTQLHRVVFRKKDTAQGAWSTFSIEADSLGQDTVATINIAPRKASRASQVGSTEHPISGTFDSLSASVTFLADNFSLIGKALDRWTAATYTGHDANAGQVVLGDGTNFCDAGYYSVVIQGLCDDGSAADIEICRCNPSIDDDLEFGSSETPEVTLALNPIIYNATLHSADGYEQMTIRLGEYDTAVKKRLNATTGAYDTVTES